MRLRRDQDPATWLDAVEDFLPRDAARNVLLYAAVEALRERPELISGPPWLATVEDDGGSVVGAGTLWPPNPLALSPLTPPDALPLIADDLVAAGRVEQVNAMSCTEALVAAFLPLWRERTGRAGEVHTRMRLYRIDAPPRVPDVPGQFRMATAADLDLLVDWSLAFEAEAWHGGMHSDRERLRANVRARIEGRGGGVGLWVVDGECVSMAAYGGRPPTLARLAPVYTPPALRRHGYGSAVTAALTAEIFARGHPVCMLFTDLANPTSNRIYADIGYRAVTDWVHARIAAG